MSLFHRKQSPGFPFGDILRGLQHAVSSAVEMLQAQQVQALGRFWSTDGRPVTQKVKIGERTLDIPLISMVPHSTLQMQDVEVRFKARIGDVAQELQNDLLQRQSLPQADMMLSMSGLKDTDDGNVEVTVTFKIKDCPEALSRVIDEYNALIN